MFRTGGLLGFVSHLLSYLVRVSKVWKWSKVETDIWPLHNPTTTTFACILHTNIRQSIFVQLCVKAWCGCWELNTGQSFCFVLGLLEKRLGFVKRLFRHYCEKADLGPAAEWDLNIKQKVTFNYFYFVRNGSFRESLSLDSHLCVLISPYKGPSHIRGEPALIPLPLKALSKVKVSCWGTEFQS